MNFQSIFFLFFILMICYQIYYVIRHKGFKNAFFGGEIVKTTGEVEFNKHSLASSKLKVHRINVGSDNLVAIEVVYKTFLSYRMIPITLSREQAIKVADLIKIAAN